MKTNFLALDLQFGRVLVSDRQPKRAVRFQHPMHALDPLAAPVDVLLVIDFVVVDVVVITNVERRISKRQVDRALIKLLHTFDAVAV